MSEELKLHFHMGETEATPEEAGYNPETVDRLDSHFANLVNNNVLQCASYLLAKDGKVFACKSMGKLRYNNDSLDLMPDSIRWIASITKVFTSIAILQLAEKGLIYIQQPVYTILKEFDTPKYKTITIFHLLTHTSGLRPDSNFTQEVYPLKWWNSVVDNNWLTGFLAGTPHCAPGEQWMYSSMGFAVLGEIISKVSGINYEQYVMDNIVKPLVLNKTFFQVPKQLKEQVCLTTEGQEKYLYSDKDRTGEPPNSGGGLFSSLYDLNRIGQMLLNKGTLDGVRILGRKTVEAMTRNYLENTPNYGWGGYIADMSYGLGMHVKKEAFLSVGSFSHEGAGRSALYMDPTENFLAAYFIPTNESWTPLAMVATRALMWSGIK